MNWQPIETAPKDDTRILLADHEYVAIGRWRLAIQADEGWQEREAWMTWDCEDALFSGRFDNPTHWAPLPSPPR